MKKPNKKRPLWLSIVCLPLYLLYYIFGAAFVIFKGIATFIWSIICSFFEGSSGTKARNGYDYEYTAAAYLKNNGYKNVKVTKSSGDYGVDVLAEKHGHKYAVQCKYYSKPVSVGAVQEVVAGMAMYNCDRGIVITNNTFTKPAENLAEKNGIELIPNIAGANSGGRFPQLKALFFLVSIVLIVSVTSTSIGTIRNVPIEQGILIILSAVFTIISAIAAYSIINTLLKLKIFFTKYITILLSCASVSLIGELVRKLLSSNIENKLNSSIIEMSVLFIIMVLLIGIYNLVKKKITSSEVSVEINSDDYDISGNTLDEMTTNNSDVAGTSSNEPVNTILEVPEYEIEYPIENSFDKTESNNLISDDEKLQQAIDKWIKSFNNGAIEEAKSEEEIQREDERIQKEIEECEKSVEKELNRVADLLVPTFKAYKVDIELIDKYHTQQKITLSIRPAPGVKINTIKNVLLDVSLAIGINPLKMFVDSQNRLIYLYTNTNITFPDLQQNIHNYDSPIDDSIFYQAVIISMEAQCVSASFLQRKLKVGYARSARIMDIFDEIGFIGPAEPEGKPRKVLMTKEYIISKYS